MKNWSAAKVSLNQGLSLNLWSLNRGSTVFVKIQLEWAQVQSQNSTLFQMHSMVSVLQIITTIWWTKWNFWTTHIWIFPVLVNGGPKFH